MPHPSYDLLTEPWVPVTTSTGEEKSVGLRELFATAHEIADLSESNPLVLAGVLRLLLAVVYRVDSPKGTRSWKKIWERGRFDPAKYEAYFDKWSDRFDLFHVDKPFFQIGGFETIKNGKPTPTDVARLHQAWSVGNNNTLFDHRVDGSSKVSPGLVARLLLATQYACLGGGKGPTSNHFGPHPYSSHGVGAGGLFVATLRATLFETITSNVIPLDRLGSLSSAEDRPVWECTEHRVPGVEHVLGVMDLLTFPARYVRLVPSQYRDRCSIKEMYFAQGLAVSRDLNELRRPWTGYRISKDGEAVPVGLRAEVAVWRDAGALMTHATHTSDRSVIPLRPMNLSFASEVASLGSRLAVRCIGLANDKAKPIAWRTELLSLPAAALSDPRLADHVDLGLKLAKSIAGKLRVAVRKAAEVSLESPVPGEAAKSADRKDVSRIGDRCLAAADFWSPLESGFVLFVDGVVTESSAATKVWFAHLCRAARDAFARGVRHLSGDGVRRLRGEVAGESFLNAMLAKLREEHALAEPANPDEPATKSNEEAMT